MDWVDHEAIAAEEAAAAAIFSSDDEAPFEMPLVAPAAQVPVAVALVAPPEPPPLAAPEDTPSGPRDAAGARGGRARRQYCWWVTFSYPLPETVARLGLKTPDEFTRETFCDTIRAAYTKAKVSLEEVAVFRELHERADDSGRRLPHLNALCRSSTQHAWTGVAAALRSDHNIRVDFGENIRSWYDGVVYGTVSSDHKPQAELDSDPFQWAVHGTPVPFLEVLPAKWHKQGRQPKLTKLQVLDIIRHNKLWSETLIYAHAASEEAAGRRGLVAFLSENDQVEVLIRKAQLLTDAPKLVAKACLSLIEQLQSARASQPCTCPVQGQWLAMAQEILHHNGLTGVFEQAVYRALAEGRKKKNNVFIVGESNCGKSFLLNPLKMLFACYQQPDSGSYQLETLLDKQVMFLNDFSWDHNEKWCSWAYFKCLLEGGEIPVGRPKNKGADVVYRASCPILGTCASPIQLLSKQLGGRGALVVDTKETQQMHNRINYLRLTVPIPEASLVECSPCAVCAATLYLQGQVQGVPLALRERSRSPRH